MQAKTKTPTRANPNQPSALKRKASASALSATKKNKSSTPSGWSPRTPKTPGGGKGDIRQKIREGLQKALDAVGAKQDPPLAADQTTSIIASQIEANLFAKHSNTGGDYKDQYRTLALNLRDPSNPELAVKLISGVLSPHRVVNCEEEELAGEKTKEIRKENHEYMKDFVRCDWQPKSYRDGKMLVSGVFTCRKCKGGNCYFYQKQTRSADEPMTTFINCLDCGKRWREC